MAGTNLRLPLGALLLVGLFLGGCISGVQPEKGGDDSDSNSGPDPDPSVRTDSCEVELVTEEVAPPGGPATLRADHKLLVPDHKAPVLTVYPSSDYSSPIAREVLPKGADSFSVSGLPTDTVDVFLEAKRAFPSKLFDLPLRAGDNHVSRTLGTDHADPEVTNYIPGSVNMRFKVGVPADTARALAEHLRIESIWKIQTLPMVDRPGLRRFNKEGEIVETIDMQVRLRDDQHTCTMVDRFVFDTSVLSAAPSYYATPAD